MAPNENDAISLMTAGMKAVGDKWLALAMTLSAWGKSSVRAYARLGRGKYEGHYVTTCLLGGGNGMYPAAMRRIRQDWSLRGRGGGGRRG